MAELPSLDDDIENDLYDDMDLETNVFVRKETAVHEKARPSHEKMTSMPPKGASNLPVDAGTSEYKSVVIDNIIKISNYFNVLRGF